MVQLDVGSEMEADDIEIAKVKDSGAQYRYESMTYDVDDLHFCDVALLARRPCSDFSSPSTFSFEYFANLLTHSQQMLVPIS